MLSGAADLIALEEELRSLEQAMAAGDHDQATLARYADAQARLEHAGGYAWRDRTAGVVRGLGFTDADLDRLLDTFSGGELTRASLARALAGDPDLLLLDEPTNHLDVESIEWLERELQSLDAAVILVAHDRWFLEAVTNGVLELSGGRSLYFKGPWHQWRLEKAARAQHAQKALDRLDEDIARLERFVERFRYKKNKAKQAQAKLTHIGRLEEERGGQAQTLDRLTTKKRSMGFDFLKPRGAAGPWSRPPASRSRRATRSSSTGRLRAGTRRARRARRPERLGQDDAARDHARPPRRGRREGAARARRRGRVLLAAGARAGRARDRPRLRPGLHGASASVGAEPARPLPLLGLGRAVETGDRALRRERRRLALAIVVASGANFLVLDEPTNHLDLESREALEAALEAFPGTVLLVSHDRALLDAVAQRTMAIEDRGLRSYEGGWAELIRRREEVAKAAEPPEPKVTKKPKTVSAKPAGPTALQVVEADIEKQEERVAELERELADDWGNADLLRRHRAARDELQALLARWERLFESSGV